MKIMMATAVLLCLASCQNRDSTAEAPTTGVPEAAVKTIAEERAERHANIEATKHNPSVADPSKASAPIKPRFVIPHDADKPMHGAHHAR